MSVSRLKGDIKLRHLHHEENLDDENLGEKLFIIPSLTNCIIHVEGPEEDKEKFFNMVASNKIYFIKDYPEKVVDCRIPKIGTFCWERAIDSLIHIDPHYLKDVARYIRGYYSLHDAPDCINTYGTSKKYNGSEIYFFVNLQDFFSPNPYYDGIKALRRILACYAYIFPSLKIWFGINTIGRFDPQTNKRISVIKLMKEKCWSVRCGRYIGVYSDSPLRYTMKFEIFNRNKFLNNVWDIRDNPTIKQRTFTL